MSHKKSTADRVIDEIDDPGDGCCGCVVALFMLIVVLFLLKLFWKLLWW